MIVVSYDIQDDKLRSHFAKMLKTNGAIRLQYSVYEVNNTKRVIDNIIVKIDSVFSRKFTGSDSVIIFIADNDKLIKYGNAIHRDTDIVFF
jgi:CRISPR-associated protein Cas2